MLVSLIVAMDQNRLIGAGNKMPWHLPADLRHFRQTTLGKPVVMGRKTFESIGKPLPGRRNLVVSGNRGFVAPGCEVSHSLGDALSACEAAVEVMVIGGATIYTQALPRADRLYLTTIEHAFDGDTYFPQWSQAEWTLESQERHKRSPEVPWAYSFSLFCRLGTSM